MSNAVSKVAVLMSTYNGEKYIKEQIDSILAQKGVEVELFIRDDGSSDSTSTICEEYARTYPNVSFYRGDHLGVGKSFMKLLRDASEADFYSFADQDDVWHEKKLIRATSMIKKAEMSDINYKIHGGYPVISDELTETKSFPSNQLPVLYGSNLSKVDKDLEPMGLRFSGIPQCDLLSSLSRNIISGCTMVMNKTLRETCVGINDASDKVLFRKYHDGWIICIAYITGVLIYDRESYINYREHPEQVVGVKEISGIKLVMSRINRFLTAKNKGVRSTLAKDLLERLSDEMDPEIKYHLEILSKAGSAMGIIRLLEDRKLASSFQETRAKILLRGILGWI